MLNGKDLAIAFLSEGRPAVDSLVPENMRHRAWSLLVEFLEERGAEQAAAARKVLKERYSGIVWTSKTPRPPQLGERRTLTAQPIVRGVGTRTNLHLGPCSPGAGGPVYALWGHDKTIYVRTDVPPEESPAPKPVMKGTEAGPDSITVTIEGGSAATRTTVLALLAAKLASHDVQASVSDNTVRRPQDLHEAVTTPRVRALRAKTIRVVSSRDPISEGSS